MARRRVIRRKLKKEEWGPGAGAVVGAIAGGLAASKGEHGMKGVVLAHGGAGLGSIMGLYAGKYAQLGLTKTYRGAKKLIRKVHK